MAGREVIGPSVLGGIGAVVDVRGSRVGVVGGSIGGCAAAIALGRLGCDVTVFERSSGALRDRGSGIAIPVDLRNELIEHDYLPTGYRCWPDDSTPADIRRAGTRRWIIADGSPAGRLLWEQASGGAAVYNNWSVLWHGQERQTPATKLRAVTRAAGPGAQEHDVGNVVDVPPSAQ